MRLFAERGVEAVSVRDIAAAAGVSPSLVVHHYRSKAGLRAAVDARATGWIAELLEQFTGSTEAAGSMNASSIGAVLGEAFATQPAVVGYLRRLLVDGGPAADALFGSLFEVTVAGLAQMEAAGIARPAADPAVRAAFLLANDLAMVLLRDQIAAVLGTDPFGREGLTRWSEVVLEVYGNGVLQIPEAPQAQQEGAGS